MSYIVRNRLKFAKISTEDRRNRIDIQRNNAIRANLIATQFRETYLLIAMAFAFIIPYSALLYFGTYVTLVKPSLHVKTYFTARCLSAGLLYSNGAINFIKYVVHMKAFRAFSEKLFCGKGNSINSRSSEEGIQLRASVTSNNSWLFKSYKTPWQLPYESEGDYPCNHDVPESLTRLVLALTFKRLQFDNKTLFGTFTVFKNYKNNCL